MLGTAFMRAFTVSFSYSEKDGATIALSSVTTIDTIPESGDVTDVEGDGKSNWTIFFLILFTALILAFAAVAICLIKKAKNRSKAKRQALTEDLNSFDDV